MLIPTRMKRKPLPLFAACLCSIALLSSLGCNSESKTAAQVQGTVTIDGELAPSGTVTFHSEDGHPMSYGSILKDGTFALRVGQGNRSNPNYNDIPPGDYVATVSIRGPSKEDPNATPGAPPLAGPLLIAKKYTSKSSSGLKFTIKSGLNVIAIPLERPSPEEEQEESEEQKSDDGSVDEPEEELSETEEAVDKILTDAASEEQESDTASVDSAEEEPQ